MFGIYEGEFRIGATIRMTGNEPDRRWMAYSRYPADGAEPGALGERRGFAGKREAVVWLKLKHRQRPCET